jgi:hypothetical protein
MNCDCVKRINDQLAEQNFALDTSFLLTGKIPQRRCVERSRQRSLLRSARFAERKPLTTATIVKLNAPLVCIQRGLEVMKGGKRMSKAKQFSGTASAVLRFGFHNNANDKVQCADCFAWIKRDENHTCKAQIRRNQKAVKK